MSYEKQASDVPAGFVHSLRGVANAALKYKYAVLSVNALK